MNKPEYIFSKLAMYDTSIGDYWGYFKNLVQHKSDVYSSGREFSVPRTRLLLHDWDKFFPKMFKRYAEWFHGPQGRLGSRNPDLKKEWNTMVETHKDRSEHHNPSGSFEAELEAIADWYSAAKRAASFDPNFPTVEQWLRDNLTTLNVSPYTKQYLSAYI